MTANTEATAGGAQLVGAPGHPASSEDSGRGQHDAESVLSLNSGAGPKSTEDSMAQPVRFDDPARNAAYWARITRIVDVAPPLDDTQRAIIRTAFHQPTALREAA